MALTMRRGSRPRTLRRSMTANSVPTAPPMRQGPAGAPAHCDRAPTTTPNPRPTDPPAAPGRQRPKPVTSKATRDLRTRPQDQKQPTAQKPPRRPGPATMEPIPPRSLRTGGAAPRTGSAVGEQWRARRWPERHQHDRAGLPPPSHWSRRSQRSPCTAGSPAGSRRPRARRGAGARHGLPAPRPRWTVTTPRPPMHPRILRRRHGRRAHPAGPALRYRRIRPAPRGRRAIRTPRSRRPRRGLRGHPAPLAHRGRRRCQATASSEQTGSTAYPRPRDPHRGKCSQAADPSSLQLNQPGRTSRHSPPARRPAGLRHGPPWSPDREP